MPGGSHELICTILGSVCCPRFCAEDFCSGNAGILDCTLAGHAASILGNDVGLHHCKSVDRCDMVEGGLPNSRNADRGGRDDRFNPESRERTRAAQPGRRALAWHFSLFLDD